jgi:iron complex transport system permease protein
MKLTGAVILLLLLILVTLGYPNPDGQWFGFLRENASVDQKLFWILRLPEICICLAAGAALAVAGLLLQTFLNNPLAGPSILGLTSGSHLLVAITTMVSASWSSSLAQVSITSAAAIGALVFGLIIVLLSNSLRSKVSLLLVGMMLGTFVSAITNIIITRSDPSAIKAFTMWSMGTLSQVELTDFELILPVLLVSIIGGLFLCKQLDALQLGESHAIYLGVNYNRTKWMILIIVSVLTGLITSYCGPIAFVGLIVPNVVRMIYRTGRHRLLLIYSLIWGAIVLVMCDLIKLVLDPIITIPINVLTSLMGAPIVVLLILKQRKNA